MQTMETAAQEHAEQLFPLEAPAPTASDLGVAMQFHLPNVAVSVE